MKHKLLLALITAPLLIGLSGCAITGPNGPAETGPTLDAKTQKQIDAAASAAASKAGAAAQSLVDKAKNWNQSDTDKVVANLKKLGKAVTDIKVTHTTEGGQKVTVVSYKLNGKTHSLHLTDSDFSLKNLIP